METAKVIRKSYKFRIYPTKAQIGKLETWLGLCRELYNAALQERRDAWRLNRISINYFDQQNQLPELKQIRLDLKDINSSVLQNCLRRLDNSFKDFYRRVKNGEKAGLPRFKSQQNFNSFSVPNTRYKFKKGKFNLSRLGLIKIKLHRKIEGVLKTATIRRQCGKWYVIIAVEYAPEILPKTNNSIGIDVGLKFFAVLSNGEFIENPRFTEKSLKKLRVARRRVSRRKKGSNRRQKADLQVSKIHQKIFNQRNDFQHKLSTRIVAENDLIAIEKLNIKGLGKSILSKQVLNASWSSFFMKLRYKAENAGKELVEVKAEGTSQTCLCGAKVEKTLAVRKHNCLTCGTKCDRDFMSAQVILQRAQVERSSANVNQ